MKKYKLLGTTIALKIIYGDVAEWLIDTYPRLIEENENNRTIEEVDNNFIQSFLNDYVGNGIEDDYDGDGIEEVKICGTDVIRYHITINDVADGIIKKEMDYVFKRWNNTILEY